MSFAKEKKKKKKGKISESQITEPTQHGYNNSSESDALASSSSGHAQLEHDANTEGSSAPSTQAFPIVAKDSNHPLVEPSATATQSESYQSVHPSPPLLE